MRWVIIGVALIVLAVEAGLVWDQLAKAWASLLSANGWWVLAANGIVVGLLQVVIGGSIEHLFYFVKSRVCTV